MSALERRLAKVRGATRRFARDSSRVGSGGIRLTIADDSAAGGYGLDRVFVGLGATLDAFPEALRDTVPAVRAAHRAVFRSEGAAGRGAWPALAPSTIAQRRRLGYGPGPILLRTGALREHVLGTPAKISRVAGGVELRIAPTPVVAGRPKYRALARGNPASNLPGRPMVAVGPAAAASITSALSRSLRGIAARNGLS